MTDLFVTKVKTATGYALMPAHQSDLDAIKKLPTDPLRVKVTRPRNLKFHRKIWALIDVLFDYWEPSCDNVPAYIRERGIEPVKDRDRFRKDLIITAGFFDATYRINGDVRVEAKSMAFDKMSEDEAETLFNRFIDIGVNMANVTYTGDELRQTVDTILSFDS